MPGVMLPDEQIRELLAKARTIAVVGLSANPARPSHGVASFLQRHGYRVVPVNPNLGAPVLGEEPYASLRDVPFRVDIVDIFRRSEFVAAIVDDAIAVGAGAVWMQLDVIDHAAAARAAASGLGVVMDRCIAVEHGRLLG
jgi:uncharacterized protein